MKFRKIKDLRKTNRGNRKPRTENQIRSATLRMLLDNPMWKEENKKKQTLRMILNNPRKKLFDKQQPSG